MACSLWPQGFLFGEGLRCSWFVGDIGEDIMVQRLVFVWLLHELKSVHLLGLRILQIIPHTLVACYASLGSGQFGP